MSVHDIFWIDTPLDPKQLLHMMFESIGKDYPVEAEPASDGKIYLAYAGLASSLVVREDECQSILQPYGIKATVDVDFWWPKDESLYQAWEEVFSVLLSLLKTTDWDMMYEWGYHHCLVRRSAELILERKTWENRPEFLKRIDLPYTLSDTLKIQS